MPPPSQEPFILPESTNQAIFQQFIQPSLLRFSIPVAAPVVVFLSGQPGSGKSSLAAYYGKQFNETGDGVVTINSDELREYHPEYATIQRANHPDHASFLVNPDTRAWQHKLITVAIAQRRHTLLDGTLGGPVEPILETMQQFRQAGYVIWVGIMAVPAYQSRLGIYQRYQDQVELKGMGHWVGMGTHDAVYAQLPDRIDYLEQQQLIDEIIVFARPVTNQPPTLLYQNRLTNGRWESEPKAGQALAIHRNRLLTYAEYKAHKAVVQDVQRQVEQTAPDLDKTRAFLAHVAQTAIQHRTATAADVQLYFDWANDPVTRRQSFNSVPISWETHEAWFARKLTDPDALLLVFETSTNVPIGQVRFERLDGELTEKAENGDTGTSAEKIVVLWPEAISLSIDAQFRGKGIASVLIEEACDVLHKQKGPVPIVAYIKSENTASVRAFERVGFVQQASGQPDQLRLVKH